MVTNSRLYIEYLYVIDSGFAYGGIIIRNGKVVEAAPIFSQFLGHTTKSVKWMLSKKRWEIVKIFRIRMNE